MNPAELVAARMAQLRATIEQSFELAQSHSKAFALRVLGRLESGDAPSIGSFDLQPKCESVQYEGIPDLAYLGYGIGAMSDLQAHLPVCQSFLEAFGQLRKSGKRRVQTFAADEIAVLGVADGLARIAAANLTLDADVTTWLVATIEGELPATPSAKRIAALAAELVIPSGRLKTQLDDRDIDLLAFDLCLRQTWPAAFQGAPQLAITTLQRLLKNVLTNQAPATGEPDRAAVWIVALNALIEGSAAALLPTISDTVRLLQATQTALKRWVWETESRSTQAPPAHWLIENEYHVQSLLWAVLYPVFREHLIEEEFLQGSVLQQPRTDFGITNLKLIIEAKIIRHESDFKNIEQQIAGDLGLYFRDTNRYDRLVVYIYDDCDRHRPELYAVLQHALKGRDSRIEDVIIVRRPNAMPSRKERRPAEHKTAHSAKPRRAASR